MQLGQLFLLLLGAAVLVGAAPQTSPIKHVVVLMMENRSFDHILGYLNIKDPSRGVKGLTGTEWNPVVPDGKETNGTIRDIRIPVTFDAEWLIGADPGHAIDETTAELFGQGPVTWPAPMDGFVWANHLGHHTMRVYNDSMLPATYTAAEQFALIDEWHASVPGPTMPNRLFFMTGTAHGVWKDLTWEEWLDLPSDQACPQRTLFNDIHEAGLEWGYYWSDAPSAMGCKQFKKICLGHLHLIHEFEKHAREGKLGAFSFIEPRYYNFGPYKRNDQHPPFSTILGDQLIKQVYDAVRSSPQWNETALIITYDEHGGLFDHQSPPPFAPSPDKFYAPDFKYDRPGVRVPFIIVSPWVPKGAVFHGPEKGMYDHTSMAATLRKLFPQMSQTPLTPREAFVKSFEHVFTQLDAPRTDVPETLPLHPAAKGQYWEQLRVEREAEKFWAGLTEEQVREYVAEADGGPPLDGLQESLLGLAWALGGGDAEERSLAPLFNEAEAAMYVRKSVLKWVKEQEAKGVPTSD